MPLEVSTDCLSELLRRLGRVAQRIEGAEYGEALRALRYWDAGYDLADLPSGLRTQLQELSLSARFCLTRGDGAGAADHVASAVAIARSLQPGAAEPRKVAVGTVVYRRRRQTSKRPS